MAKRILLVEDEKNIARFIELELQHENFEVVHLVSGRDGLEAAKSQEFDVVLLDVMLPELNGIEVCRRIRSFSPVPIILITARDAVMDRVAGLDAGADDYIVKPFAIEELLARIRSVLRRTNNVKEGTPQLAFKDIRIYLDAHLVEVNQNTIDLTKTEYDLLIYLIKQKNRVLARELILENVWGYLADIETNVVDVYINHLRSKLPKNYIETVRGVGYVMRE
ncbi:response regulator transcription factor [Paenisporosarcina sp. TG20]|uniref:response regulator transcription factor n=1 Tax=Paenisporosarcina sp. TG20 TaxID=1211706 RepID=UPI00030CC829|nr:response regulator transcription factor [Paenisporosarcina sp. TG20]